MKTIPVNNYIIIASLTDNNSIPFTFGESEYKVVLSGNSSLYKSGDNVIVEEQFIVKLVIQGEEKYFVKEDNILAIVQKNES